MRFGQAAEQREIRASKCVADALGINLEIGEIRVNRNFRAGEVPGRNALLAFTAVPLLDGSGLCLDGHPRGHTLLRLLP